MKYISIFVMLILFSGCVNSRDKTLGTQKTQVQTRSYQTETFDDISREELLQAAIATLQDLGFVIMHGDYNLGLVSAKKLGYAPIKMTLTTRKKNKNQILLRASGQQGIHEITDVGFYNQFFASVRKSLFLDKSGS